LENPTRRKLEIEKYIKDYENGMIPAWQIAIKEGSNESKVRRAIKEYYDKQGKEVPKVVSRYRIKEFDIEKYIEDYENGKISISKIAEIEKTDRMRVSRKINEYYDSNELIKPENIPSVNKKNIDIEAYIEDINKKNTTIKQIAELENTSSTTIYKRVNDYNREKGIIKNQKMSRSSGGISKTVKTTIKEFLKRGLNKEEIAKIALKRNIVIPDEVFDDLLKEMNNEEVER